MIDILSYSHTRRYHCVQIIGHQTVAEHSARVAMLADQIMDGKASANLLRACLRHDLAESVTGDVPATAKWRNPDLNFALHVAEARFEEDNDLHVELTGEEEAVLKWADALECLYFCVDQLLLGNRHARVVCENVIHHLKDRPHVGKSEQVYEMIWEKYHGAI